jgi:hypothetical protein
MALGARETHGNSISMGDMPDEMKLKNNSSIPILYKLRPQESVIVLQLLHLPHMMCLALSVEQGDMLRLLVR